MSEFDFSPSQMEIFKKYQTSIWKSDGVIDLAVYVKLMAELWEITEKESAKHCLDLLGIPYEELKDE